MGLPTVDITFRAPAVKYPTRAERGVLAIVVQDATETFDFKSYAALSDVDSDDYTAANYASIARAFTAAPNRVIVVRIGTSGTITDASAILDTLSYDWVCSNVAGLQAGLVTYVKSINTPSRARKVKCVATGAGSADDEHIVNVANTSVTLSGDNSSTAMALYLPRLAGVLAACPLDASVTFMALTDLSDVAAVASVDTSIDGGNLCLIKDDDTIRIARGVNTLQTLTGKTADMKKICVVEGMDRTRYEIILLFKNSYLGQVKNDSDHQAILLSDILGILADLTLEGVLDDAATPTAEIDVAAMRTAWTTAGTDVSGLTDAQVKAKTYGSKVFILCSGLKYLDAMEDLSMVIQLD